MLHRAAARQDRRYTNEIYSFSGAYSVRCLPILIVWLVEIDPLSFLICRSIVNMGNKQNSGCGCLRIPFSVVVLMLGGSYWWLIYLGNFTKITKLLSPIQLPSPIANLFLSKSTNSQPIPSPNSQPIVDRQPVAVAPAPSKIDSKPQASPPITASPIPTNLQNSWEKKAIRGIYLSRYQVTNNADEQTIRDRKSVV